MKYPFWGALIYALLPGFVGANEHSLTVYEYFGYEDPSLHVNFNAKYGRSPSYMFYRDEDVAFDHVKDGLSTDLVHLCIGSLEKWVDSGLLEPWDFSRIDVAKFEDFGRSKTQRQQDLAAYFVPYDYGTTLLTYNAQQVPKSDVQSLNVFRDPAYAGRVSVPTDPDDLLALAFLAIGATDWENPSEREIEDVISWLEDVDGNIHSYWEDEDEITDLMVSGEVLVSWAWNSIAVYSKIYTSSIEFQLTPIEGSTIWTCGYVKLKGNGAFDDQAYDYVNALLSEPSVEPLLEWGVGLMNKEALANESTPEDLAELGLVLPDGPILLQTPMSLPLRERLLSALSHLGNRS